MLDKAAVSTGYTVAAWILTGIALVLVLVLHLLPALIAGLLVFELVHVIEPPLHTRFPDRRRTLIAVGLLVGLVVLVVAGLVGGMIVFFNSDVGSVSALLSQMADTIVSARSTMPEWLAARIPDNAEALDKVVMEWMHDNAAMVGLAGAHTGRGLVYVFLGLILGAMIALHEAMPREPHRNLSSALIERAKRLSSSFRKVVFAQVRISLVNTLLTAAYLAVILPAFGVDLPLRKTMIAVTFVVGLLPVIGNLLSNTIIVVISLSYSAQAALASLVFLILIHKLEYFLNARIIGHRIDSRAWELLMAMIAMEAAFGIAGVIAAPIYFAYLKSELAAQGAI
jgi:predicted PurR-regulated permease PerM